MPLDMKKSDIGKTRPTNRVKKEMRGGSRPNAGRKVGSLSEKSKNRLNKIDEVLEQLDSYILDDIASLPPRIRAQFWKDLVEYRRPKLARTESEVELKKSVIKVLDSVEGDGIKATFSVPGTTNTSEAEDKDDDLDDFLKDI